MLPYKKYGGGGARRIFSGKKRIFYLLRCSASKDSQTGAFTVPLSLPLCTCVQFTRNSIRAFNDGIKIIGNKGL